MGGATQAVVEVAAVVVAVVAPEIIPVIGDAVLSVLPEEVAAAVTDAGITSTQIGTAAIGGGSSGFNTAVSGGSPEQIIASVAEGAGASLVGSAVGEAAGGFVGGEQAGPFLGSEGQVVPGPTYEGAGIAGATDSKAAGNILGKGGAGGFSTGFTKAELSGQNLQQALRRGEIGGATGMITAGLSEALQAADVPSSAARGLATTGSLALGPTISSMFPADTPASRVGGTSASRQATAGGLPTTGGRTLGGGGYGYYPAVGSAALGQALNIGAGGGAGAGSTGGYGATGEQLSPETGGKQQTVWNIESLRVKPEET